MSGTFWTINAKEYFEAPGMAATVFHDSYPEGKQGGISLFHHGERIASCGDLRLSANQSQWGIFSKPGKRTVTKNTVSVNAVIDDSLSYSVSVMDEGKSLIITLSLDAPLPEAFTGSAGFSLELYPPAYTGRSLLLGGTATMFPKEPEGRLRIDENGNIYPNPIAAGKKMTAAGEDPYRHIGVESLTGTLSLYDGRDGVSNGWFVLREKIPAGAAQNAVQWRVYMNPVPGWRKPPLLCYSRVGYHPDQEKRAVIELDKRTSQPEKTTLYRIEDEGRVEVLSAVPQMWGIWLSSAYAVFDFSKVIKPGIYCLSYDGVDGPVFRIDKEVYRENVWQPTLDTYFPVQMCHMEVRQGARVWHGACHLDDALQAPLSRRHFDGYRQYETSDTPFEEEEHIPGLNQGGWHDAGDYDLAAGSQARTTRILCLAREFFGAEWDNTRADWEERKVYMHTPGGRPDIIDQIVHGVLNLLSGYRATQDTDHPHSFHGIISSTLKQYGHLGDASTMTDNMVYDSSLEKGEIQISARGEPRSGVNDDRWAFTNHDSALEYLMAAALSSAYRVLKDFEFHLADECLTTARMIWEYEENHAPVFHPAEYVPGDLRTQRITAACELLLATSDQAYKKVLESELSQLDEDIYSAAGAVARVIGLLDSSEVKERFFSFTKEAAAAIKKDTEDNPFGVQWKPHVWGLGWQIQSYAVEMYQLWRTWPQSIDREIVLRAVNYVLGCNPALGKSLATGVGSESVTVAYGTNRAEWSGIPGGMISGPALVQPDFPECKEPFPHIWQQTEYVMSGAAAYIFCVLAADNMLTSEGE